MENIDVQYHLDRYNHRLAEFGYSHKTLGMGGGGRQDIRFSAMCAHILAHPESSVLDVGCGFADLYQWLRANGWRGQYTGVDINPELLAIARERNPGLNLMVAEVSRGLADVQNHDFVVAASLMNLKLLNSSNEDHIRATMASIFHACNVAATIDFMTTFVDFQAPEAWHTNPVWALGAAHELTRRVVLRADYMPYEYCITLYKNSNKSERNVYEEFEPENNPCGKRDG